MMSRALHSPVGNSPATTPNAWNVVANIFPAPADLNVPIARGLAAGLGLFTLLNLIGSWISPGFDANIWWIDLSSFPRLLASLLLVCGAAGLLCFAIGFPKSNPARRFVAFTAIALLIAVTRNVLTFYRLWHLGIIRPGIPVPLSLLLAIILLLILQASFGSWRLDRPRQHLMMLTAVGASLLLFPLAQMFCFGKTDYRRPADAIVVFGARTYADGSLSPALYDRTRTAIAMYQKGLAPLLIFSGGPGDGRTSEPQAMKNLALSFGIPASAILLDERGLNTDMSVSNTVALFDRLHLKRVLAVSHFYHLPRVKMTYTRALAMDQKDVEVFTVPAEESALLPRMPFYMAREIAALWSYYLRPLGRG